MQTGTVNVDGKDYEFNDSGELQNDDETEEDGTVYAKVCDDGSANINSEQKEANARYIYNYLTDKGWTKNAICGLLGNMEQESGINPGEWQELDVTDGLQGGYGLVQWTPSGEKILDWMGVDSSEVDEMAENDPKQLMDKQLEFLQVELIPGTKRSTWNPTTNYHSPYAMTADEYINSNYDADTLALVFHGSYERSGDSLEVIQRRGNNAKKWYDFLS